MAYIEVKDVYKRYKIGENIVVANNGINFSIEKGEFVVILGPSGAGKSTILNILGGMDNCDEGKIIIDETDISKFKDKELTKYRRYDVGFVFQFYNLVQNLTARENIELATQISNNSLDVEKTIELVGLGHRKDNFPSQLSGGEQQRVSIARAIAKNPKLLLCDEPTGALDYKTGKQVLKTLQDTCKKMGTTVVVITHNSAIAQMADRVIKINDAKVRSMNINSKPLSVEEIEW
ncbi:ABC transporter ATP-binding protein [Clostridium sp.]|jgi:putative ABC transport system ATP-binding protein|uniref:ABC transporter ATP-binding protein n=1 Tax=Clostridium sp. TaxID=1506 RepID=UPI0025C7010D|nr:ABC transporter ATP-binding protein [Clostridium sp.]MCI9069118.1 ABC transporter ATP-binding protein [Clostridium sp.]MCI9303277.1 ABC transporter ATP-binding protein [Clostridium sp.]